MDASKSGTGAVLLLDDRPITYASKSLTSTQQRSAPTEQEMLVVVFECQRFRDYMYGKKVIIQPLEAIMKKPLQNTMQQLQIMLLS